MPAQRRVLLLLSACSRLRASEEDLMEARAEIVRAFLRWAILIVYADSGRGLQGPRLSQMQLGRMLSRTDARTCMDIAYEILACMGRTASEEAASRLTLEIRRGWESESTTSGGRSDSRRRTEESVLADRLVSTLRRYGTPRTRDLLEVGASMQTWKSMESRFPGQTWQSIRDEFEREALVFWKREQEIIGEIAAWLDKYTPARA